MPMAPLLRHTRSAALANCCSCSCKRAGLTTMDHLLAPSSPHAAAAASPSRPAGPLIFTGLLIFTIICTQRLQLRARDSGQHPLATGSMHQPQTTPAARWTDGNTVPQEAMMPRENGTLPYCQNLLQAEPALANWLVPLQAQANSVGRNQLII